MTWVRRDEGRRGTYASGGQGAAAPPASFRYPAAPVVALGSLLALVAVYLFAVCTPSGQLIDHALMVRASADFGIDDPTPGWLGRIQVPLLASCFAATAVLVARTRSVGRAAESLVVLVLVLAGAYALKANLERPSFGVGPVVNSFPSNTTAVFAALAVICIGVAAPSIRPAVAVIAGALGVFVSVAVIALQWHRPGDVVGAWLLTVFVAALVRTLWPDPPRPALTDRARESVSAGSPGRG